MTYSFFLAREFERISEKLLILYHCCVTNFLYEYLFISFRDFKPYIRGDEVLLKGFSK